MDVKDLEFLRAAIEQSRLNLEGSDGGPFGAVVTFEGAIIGRGRNCVILDRDPTAHAEVVAIRDACAGRGSHDLSGCTIYASCQPCPMCQASIFWARIDRIVYAASSQDAAAAGFDDQRLVHELTVPFDQRQIPLEQALQSEAQEVFAEWVCNPDRARY